MNPEFWRGKRVFLTGHTGFKGSWLSLWLQSLGAELTGYSLKPPTYPSLFEVAEVARGMRSIEGDIRDLEFLSNSMKVFHPEIVIHMAAQPLVRRSYLVPVETYSTNVMGTVNLLEAVRHCPSVRSVVNVTTDKCYENKEWLWPYRENEPLGGYDPYSNSKGCSEFVSAAYRSSFFNAADYASHGVALATARAGNVIGGGDWAEDRLLPDILAAFAGGESLQIRNPYAIRPWQHVLEPLRGYLMLSERLSEHGVAYGEGWNFGPSVDDAKPVSWVVQEMAKLWGGSLNIEVDTREHPHEANYLKLDISKARTKLCWQPQLTLIESLGLVVDWAKSQAAGHDMHQITLEQIYRFQERTRE